MNDQPFDQDQPAPSAQRPRHAARRGRDQAPAGGLRAPDHGPVEGDHHGDSYQRDDYEGDQYEGDHYGGEHDEGDYGDHGLVEDDDYVELRPERSGCSRVLVFLALLLLVVAGGLFGAYRWVQDRIDPPGEPGELVSVEIPMGSTTEGIGRLLDAEGVIASDTVWRWYTRWRGAGPFQAGRYELHLNSHMDDVIDTLAAGPLPPETRRFTVPEGYTVDQILARLADDDRGLGLDEAEMRRLLDSGEIRWQHQPDDQPNPEGILFPETYEVDPEDGYDERSVLQMMVDQLDRTVDGLDIDSAQERFNLTPYEILIVASLIERETRIDDERPMVARVIYNRLSQGIALGIDATSCYEKDEEPCVLRVSDLESDSPYNTRRRPGLVPTPIASPGRASIAAALEPAEGPWIYYVLQDAEGNHLFTDSAAEFERGKAVCRERGLGCG